MENDKPNPDEETHLKILLQNMSVLLGLCDVEIEPGAPTDWSTNKIGGIPDWMSGAPLTGPTCRLCRRSLHQVAQVYCPLGGAAYHRTLYIFACCSTTCYNQAESWRVLRAQMRDVAYAPVSAPASSNEWATNDDCSTAPTPQDVTVATEWCDDADNWGEEEDTNDLISMVTDKLTIHSNVNFEDVKFEDNTERLKDDDSGGGKMDEPSVNEGKEGGDHEDNGCTLVAECLPEGREGGDHEDNGCALVAECLPEGREGGDHEDNGCALVAECLPESVTHSSSLEMARCVLRLPDQTGTTSDTLPDTIDEYVPCYINVIDHPTDSACHDLKHERHLLASYSRQEGVDLDTLLTSQSSVPKRSGKGTGGGESYEKSQVCHGDRTFLKFTKRIASCPQQILRYEYDGTPLHLTTTCNTKVPLCGHCGAPRVFELQLMPALVGLLRFAQSKESGVEFGTVLIYTCGQSCWTDEDVVREEIVLVQADPDNHLFR